MAHVEPSPKYSDPQTLDKLRGLQLRARTVVEGYLAGMHKSPLHGFSVEFAQHREYAPGDDLRYVDWKVFGRTNKFYLKQFEDETNLIAYLLVDTSQSMRYQGPGAAMSKLEYAKCAAAALAYLVLRQQDSVGLATFDRQIQTLVPPSSNPAHFGQLAHVLEQAQPQGETAVGPIFHDLAERLKKRGVVLIFSDLFDDLPSMMTGLKHFRHRRHDVIVFQVLDAAELDFPFRQTTLFRGLEQWPQVVTDPRSLRRAYLQEFNGFLRAVRAGCRNEGLDYVLLRSDQPLDTTLSAYLAARRSRVG